MSASKFRTIAFFSLASVVAYVGTVLVWAILAKDEAPLKLLQAEASWSNLAIVFGVAFAAAISTYLFWSPEKRRGGIWTGIFIALFSIALFAVGTGLFAAMSQAEDIRSAVMIIGMMSLYGPIFGFILFGPAGVLLGGLTGWWLGRS